jgi:hypothetical protein
MRPVTLIGYSRRERFVDTTLMWLDSRLTTWMAGFLMMFG